MAIGADFQGEGSVGYRGISMKTLIKRDLCLYLPVISFISLLLSALFAAIPDTNEEFLMLFLVSEMIGLALSALVSFQSDAKESCNVLLRAMPALPRMIVASRYLSCLLVTGVCTALYTAMTWLRIICHIYFPASLHEMPIEISLHPCAMLAAVAALLLTSAVVLPWGFFLPYKVYEWIPGGVYWGWDKLLEIAPCILNVGWGVSLLLAASLALLAASMNLSVRIFNAKES